VPPSGLAVSAKDETLPEQDPRIDSVHWYHTIDLGNGVRTPGEFDTQRALQQLPFPANLSGKRCLDVGTRDGFWAFSMEQRGAREVVGIDVDGPIDLDNPWYPQTKRAELLAAAEDQEAKGFHLAHELLGSKVERRATSVYDLDPDDIGTFDFAYVGTMLLHLRDPIGALMALRRVVTGQLLVNDSITPTGLFGRRAAAARLQNLPGPFWWMPNVAGLQRYVEAAGFRITEGPVTYTLPIDDRREPGAYKDRGSLTRREWLRNKRRRGVAHAWILAEPAPG
jgi:tRNA (mo5U34)-methyltransferase